MQKIPYTGFVLLIDKRVWMLLLAVSVS